MSRLGEGVPGRWMGVAIALTFASLAVIRVLALQGPWPRGLDGPWLSHAHWALGLAIVLAMAVLALLALAEIGVGGPPALDRAFMALVLSWVINSAGVAAMSFSPHDASMVLIRHLAYQFSVACSMNFLRVTSGRRTVLEQGLLLLQLVVASVLLVWGYEDPGHRERVLALWRVTNVLGFTMVFLVLCRTLLSDTQFLSRLTLGACLVGFGLGLSDMAVVNGSDIAGSVMHGVFCAYLTMVWLLETRLLGWLHPARLVQREKSEHSILGNEFAHTDLGEAPLPGAQPPGDEHDTGTRRRIAQELHDGVGSQLVNILASLDRNNPQQRVMADAVEQCLLDVKILVDDIDSAQECVLDALARLRYRVQSSLDRLGIQLHWDLHDDPPLRAVCDERARQILRITQESLANVIRHSRACNVSVSCRYSYEDEALLLDISDDGVGFDSRKTSSLQSKGLQGKGLQGMRRRAASIQADLLVHSLPGAGTSIVMMLPLVATPLHERSGTLASASALTQ